MAAPSTMGDSPIGMRDSPIGIRDSPRFIEESSIGELLVGLSDSVLPSAGVMLRRVN